MRHFPSILLLAAALALPGVVLAGSPASPEAQRAIVAELFEAIAAADVAKLDELYAEDIVLWTAGTMPFSGAHTKAEALEGMAMVAGMFPTGLDFTILATTVEGERIAVEAVSEGVHVSGKPYSNEYHFLVVVRDGKIVVLKEYMDTQHAKEVMVDAMADVQAQ